MKIYCTQVFFFCVDVYLVYHTVGNFCVVILHDKILCENVLLIIHDKEIFCEFNFHSFAQLHKNVPTMKIS